MVSPSKQRRLKQYKERLKAAGKCACGLLRADNHRKCQRCINLAKTYRAARQTDWLQWFRYRAYAARSADKKANLPQPAITANKLLNLLEAQSRLCAVTGLPLLHHSDHPQAASLDRLDNTRGHDFNNIRLVCLAVNLVRSATSLDDTTAFFSALSMWNTTRGFDQSIQTTGQYNWSRWCKRLTMSSKCNAKSTWYTHTITENDVEDILVKQRYHCAITGLPLLPTPKRLTTASLDRIDSGQGYTVGNIQLVCYAANIAKRNWDENIIRQFFTDCKAVGG